MVNDVVSLPYLIVTESKEWMTEVMNLSVLTRCYYPSIAFSDGIKGDLTVLQAKKQPCF